MNTSIYKMKERTLQKKCMHSAISRQKNVPNFKRKQQNILSYTHIKKQEILRI